MKGPMECDENEMTLVMASLLLINMHAVGDIRISVKDPQLAGLITSALVCMAKSLKGYDLAAIEKAGDPTHEAAVGVQ